MFSFSEITLHCGGEILQLSAPEAPVNFLLTDSRQAVPGQHSLFFAIRGERHDGHHYLQELYDQGCRQFIVEEAPRISLPLANICRVKNSLLALQQVAAARRAQFSYPVIGISGSNGKTIVKEWLSQLLAQQLTVVKSPKSYNSQLGVPLSVWQMGASHNIAVIEAGISLPGEMQRLQQVIQPTLGIFTNLGPAHDEGFTDRRQKAAEKAHLFSSCQKIIYRKDYPELREVLEERFEAQRLLSWSDKENASVRVHFEKKSSTQVLIHLRWQEELSFSFGYSDEASLENICHCIILLLHLGWSAEEIQRGLLLIRQVRMRLELKQGINGCYLLDDSYSNDLAGLKIALDQLARQPRRQRMTLILSDLLQTGETEARTYADVVSLLQTYPLDRILGIGEQISRQAPLFDLSGWELRFYPDTAAFLDELQTEDFHQENILIKGARRFGFERIVQRLQQKIHSTTLEIRLDALTDNLNYFRSRLQENTRLMVMVKAFSYGGAAFEIASLLQFHRVNYLAVAYVDEGIMLREHGIRTPILVLNPSPDSFELLQKYQLEPEIYSLPLLRTFISFFADQAQLPAIQLKMDTGMHRLGFQPDQLSELLSLLRLNPQLRVSAVFTHLVASEDPAEDAFTHQQAALYQQMYEQICETLSYRPLRHMLNSAGISRFPEYQMDMVRLGIGLYGVDPSAEGQAALRPISRLSTVISQIKLLQPGESVGYNRKGKVSRPSTIATIAIGYADGLDRRLGNGRLKVYVNGQTAPTIGNICMDMSMIDVTGLEVKEGDEVVIFGDEQPVRVLAEAMGTIPYEVLTGISERVKRVFYSEI
ncbi:MAG: bifunctional UDP-N-acetylmuramoyl-tripeptide:D-alanyl-D-alanine ligase/alanine racemase [Cyclobacteriaceae bacterium]